MNRLVEQDIDTQVIREFLEKERDISKFPFGYQQIIRILINELEGED